MRFTRRVYRQAFDRARRKVDLTFHIRYDPRLEPYCDAIGVVASEYAHTADLIAARAAREGKPLDER
jgi:hypothetical protein